MTDTGNAKQIIENYLLAMENRALDEAAAFLSEEFHMVFPGDTKFRRLEELIDWSRTRYQKIAKTYDHFDICETPDATIVYCYGTLHGTWLSGDVFEGIRFIDRFTVREGKIIDQRVWNDLEIFRPV